MIVALFIFRMAVPVASGYDWLQLSIRGRTSRIRRTDVAWYRGLPDWLGRRTHFLLRVPHEGAMRMLWVVDDQRHTAATFLEPRGEAGATRDVAGDGRK